jgi:Fe2+ or Zn2+ uptake regulation protein
MVKEEAKNILQKNKIRSTPKRVVLLCELAKCKKPISAGALLKILEKEIPMDLVTLYRNLTLLRDENIVKELNLQKGTSVYEYNGGVHHHHFICNGCGYIEDIHDCVSQTVTDKALKNSKKFSNVSDHSFELFGFCNLCIKKK